MKATAEGKTEHTMKWGDSNRDHDTILAVWPSCEPLSGIWQIQELAVAKAGTPKWRDRRVATASGGVKMDRYLNAEDALIESAMLNERYALELQLSQIEEHLRRSLQFKASKALQAKERLRSEEVLMLAEAKHRKAGIPVPKASELDITEKAEPFRERLADALADFPYLTGVRVGALHERIAMGKSYNGKWDLLANGTLSKRGALLIERSKIASGFDLNPTVSGGAIVGHGSGGIGLLRAA